MSSIPPEDLVKAGATLARSSTVTNALKWVALVLIYPGAVGAITWAAAKLDTMSDIRALRADIAALTEQQKKLVERLDTGLPALAAQLDGVQRDVVVVGGAALAYETEKRSREKLAAGDELAKVYDAQRRRGETPANSAMVLRTVAVPHSTR